MKKLSGWQRSVIFLCALSLMTTPLVSIAQSAPAKSAAASDPLFQTVSVLDAKLFDAYNHCDLNTLGAMVSDDLEFYHDKTGLAVGKQVFFDAIKQNICGKVHRTLVPGTLEVYPLNGYGAVDRHSSLHPSGDR